MPTDFSAYPERSRAKFASTIDCQVSKHFQLSGSPLGAPLSGPPWNPIRGSAAEPR